MSEHASSTQFSHLL